VFNILKEHPRTADWTVLHSFNLPDHGVRRRGEIDFLIMVPGKGIISLEVKSHDHVSRAEGKWVYGDATPVPRSPFEQAEQGMYAFQKRIGVLAKGIPFASAVAFTHTRFSQPAVEWKEWQVIDAASMTPDLFVEKILAVADENLKKLTKMKANPASRAAVSWYRPNELAPSSELIAMITNTVRGDFEIHIDPRDLHVQREAEYKCFLEEQFEAIDAMADEKQIFFEGAAGTGKTLLAIEEHRRSRARGGRTLFLCFNRLLGDFIRSETEESGGYRGTLDALINSRLSTVISLDRNQPSYFNDVDKVISTECMFSEQFDTIIIDEVQDFCDRGAIDLIHSIVLQNPTASLRIFGDFENQSVNFPQTASRADFIAKFPDIRNYKLTRNCRNRPGIGAAIELFTNKSDLYKGFRLSPTQNNLKSCVADTESEMLRRCEKEFLRLTRKYLPGEIVLLGMKREVLVEDIDGDFSKALTNKHFTWKSSGNKALSTTVRKFKGLDAQAVILTYLPETTDMDLMYTGMSRAIEEVVLVAPRVVLARFAGI
jgi:hypothetical protein